MHGRKPPSMRVSFARLTQLGSFADCQDLCVLCVHQRACRTADSGLVALAGRATGSVLLPDTAQHSTAHRITAHRIASLCTATHKYSQHNASCRSAAVRSADAARQIDTWLPCAAVLCECR